MNQAPATRVVSRNIDTLKIGAPARTRSTAIELESVHNARVLIERAVVADAAAHIDDGRLRARKSLSIQKQTTCDPVHFVICDREFHLTIYRSCVNPLLADFVTDLYTFMLDHRRIAVSRPGAIEMSYHDHVAIFNAFMAHDPLA